MLIVHSTYSTEYRTPSDPICKLAKKIVARSCREQDRFSINVSGSKQSKYLRISNEHINSLDHYKTPDSDPESLMKLIDLLSDTSKKDDQTTASTLAGVFKTSDDTLKCLKIISKAMTEKLPRFKEVLEFVLTYSNDSTSSNVDLNGKSLDPVLTLNSVVDNPARHSVLYGAAFIRWMILNRASFHHYNDIMMAGMIVKENHDYNWYNGSRFVIANGYGPDNDLEVGSDTAIGLGSFHTALHNSLARWLNLTSSESEVLRFGLGRQPWWAQAGTVALNTIKLSRLNKWRTPEYNQQDPVLMDCYYSYFITARQPGIKRWRISKAQYDSQLTDCDVVTKKGLAEGYDQAFSLLFWRGIPNGYPKKVICDPGMFFNLAVKEENSLDQWANAVSGVSDKGIFVDPTYPAGFRLLAEHGVNKAYNKKKLMEAAYLDDDTNLLTKIVMDKIQAPIPVELSVIRKISYE